MVSFLSEDDEPPPQGDDGLVEVLLDSEASNVGYSAVSSSVGYSCLVELAHRPVETDEEVHYKDLLIQEHLALDDGNQLELPAEDFWPSFERAMIEYVFTPTAIENDELAIDRELMSDSQKSLVPYFREADRRKSVGEYQAIQQGLRYN